MGILVIVYTSVNVVFFYKPRNSDMTKKKEYILPISIILCDVEIKFLLKVTYDIF